MKAMTNVTPIADTDETANDDDIFIMPRIRDRFHNKIRYRVSDYPVKNSSNNGSDDSHLCALTYCYAIPPKADITYGSMRIS
jgi:hypothetical protein